MVLYAFVPFSGRIRGVDCFLRPTSGERNKLIMWKKLGIAFVVLVLIIAGAAYYLLSNLDSLIKGAIEKYGSAATQTTVSVDRVNLSLRSGAGSIFGIRIANPAGYSSHQAITLGEADVQVDTGSISGTGPIIIDRVTITRPFVNYELSGLDQGSNLRTIQRNVQAYASHGAGHQPALQQNNDTGRKEIIKNLTITGGQINVSAPALNGRTLSVKLPDIHLANIGQGSGGATVAQVMNQVLGAITSEATKTASTAISQQLQSATQGAAQGALKNSGSPIPSGVVNQLKGLRGN